MNTTIFTLIWITIIGVSCWLTIKKAPKFVMKVWDFVMPLKQGFTVPIYPYSPSVQEVVQTVFDQMQKDNYTEIERRGCHTYVKLKNGSTLKVWTENRMYAWGSRGELIKDNKVLFEWDNERPSILLADKFETFIQRELNARKTAAAKKVLEENLRPALKEIKEMK